MGIAYTCNADRKLVIVVWDGTVSIQQWRAHFERMVDDPNYATAQAQLADVRSASIDASITDDAIQDMADLMAAHHAKLAGKKVALLAGSHWRRAQAIEARIASLGVTPIVFNGLDTACLWLGEDAAAVAAEIERLRAELRSST